MGTTPVGHEQSGFQVPALIVVRYGWLLLSGLPGYGPPQTAGSLPLPQWRSRPTRSSCQYPINRLRQHLTEPPTLFGTGAAPPTVENLVLTAAA